MNSVRTTVFFVRSQDERDIQVAKNYSLCLVEVFVPRATRFIAHAQDPLQYAVIPENI